MTLEKWMEANEVLLANVLWGDDAGNWDWDEELGLTKCSACGGSFGNAAAMRLEDNSQIEYLCLMCGAGVLDKFSRELTAAARSLRQERIRVRRELMKNRNFWVGRAVQT